MVVHCAGEGIEGVKFYKEEMEKGHTYFPLSLFFFLPNALILYFSYYFSKIWLFRIY